MIISVVAELLNGYIEGVLEYISAYPLTINLSQYNQSVCTVSDLR